MKALIYIVEDDPNIQNVIKIALKNAQYEVETFLDGKTMFHQLEKRIPHLLIVDIMLPGMDGLEIIQKLKKTSQYKDIGIMIVSAKSSELDKVMGLDIGADDYLIKPFGVLELISRVKALLRRQMPDEDNRDLFVHDYILSEKTHKLSYHSQSISLTNKQYELLKTMMKHPDEVLSRDFLMSEVWGYDFYGESRTLDVHIKELRKKVYLISQNKEWIETIHGIGFKISL
ncbi:MAG: response regulator transcription factor [Candidatus Izemoplasmatales bacterium]